MPSKPFRFKQLAGTTASSYLDEHPRLPRGVPGPDDRRMRLSTIKLSGFKSFVDPTTLHLPTNMTGVVGPNGCGKSNIIDAIRWVMGESAASRLRGDSLTDVIFSGSSARKPVSQATVELVFDNSDHTITGEYAAFNEISVKRTVSRDATSNYYLNGTRCRRRDITDLFLGTGLGPRSYSIIEQGMISQIIEARPEDLRVYLEEAAGISKYKERRKETETRIRHTRENLDRLSDLREEVGKQLEHLKRQARQAEQYQVLQGERKISDAEWKALEFRGLDAQRAGAAREAVAGRNPAAAADRRAARGRARDRNRPRAPRGSQRGAEQGAGRGLRGRRHAGAHRTADRSPARDGPAPAARARRSAEPRWPNSATTSMRDEAKLGRAARARSPMPNRNWHACRPTTRPGRTHCAMPKRSSPTGSSAGMRTSARSPKRRAPATSNVRASITSIARRWTPTVVANNSTEERSRARPDSAGGRLRRDPVAARHAEAIARCAQRRGRSAQAGRSAGLQEQQRDAQGELADVRKQAQASRGRLSSLETLQHAALGQEQGAATAWLKARGLDIGRTRRRETRGRDRAGKTPSKARSAS